MHAIGNEILRNNKNSKILYVTSENFTNQLINAIKDNTNDQFRNKYRSIDIICFVYLFLYRFESNNT